MNSQGRDLKSKSKKLSIRIFLHLEKGYRKGERGKMINELENKSKN